MSKRALSNWRFKLVIALLLIMSAVLFFRLVKLTILDKAFLRKQGDARSLRVVDIPAYRGLITDRNHSVLALSTPVYDIWLSPKNTQLSKEQLNQLSGILTINQTELAQKIRKGQKRSFLYIKRGVAPRVKKQIDALNIDGVYATQEFKRFYPNGAVTAQILGFTDIDDNGIEGLELAFNRWLKGRAGRERVIKDRLGRIVDKVNMIRLPQSGHSIELSIDKRLQYQAAQALLKAVEKFHAKSASAVVLDIKTGEILAMANIPSFNPNERFKLRDGSYRNRAVTDTFEPGSVMKAFSIASALDSDTFRPRDVIDTTPSWMIVDGHEIRDDKKNGKLTLTEVLMRSSNVGITKLVLASPGQQLVALLKRFGFSQITMSGFPGESPGQINRQGSDSLFDLATLGFGYGITVNVLQLAQAYAVFANEGKFVPATFLKANHSTRARQVIKQKTAKQVLSMLEAVVEKDGTGRRARITGFRVAGKTGTARIAGSHGYEKNRHIASFVGIAPVSAPKFVVAVVVHEPKKISYYSSVVAAPLFAEIMESALNIFGVIPDKVAEKSLVDKQYETF